MVPWVQCTKDRLDREDARHREMYGSGQFGWVGAMAAYDRSDEAGGIGLVGCTIVGADELEGDAAAAARELEMVRKLSKCDPSFELSRHTMVVLGRPVQVIPVMLLSSHPFPSFWLLLNSMWKFMEAEETRLLFRHDALCLVVPGVV